MNLSRYIEYTTTEAAYISGINRVTLLNHINRGWLDAEKRSDNKWYIEHDTFMSYMIGEWDRGYVMMNIPRIRSERMERIIQMQDDKIEEERRKADRKLR